MITYIAINTLNGKFYIGSTTNFEKRKNHHLNAGKSWPFQNALRKNPEAFVWEITEDDLDEPVLEQAMLDMWFGKDQCYNLCPNANRGPDNKGENNPMFGVPSPMTGKLGPLNPNYGKKRPEQAEKMRGRKRPKHSERMSGENNPMFNKNHSKETLEKQSKAKIGKLNPSYGKKWYVNPKGETTMVEECPGPEWVRGRTYGKAVKVI